MLKLIGAIHRKNPKFLMPNSFLHIPSETLVSVSDEKAPILEQRALQPWPEWVRLMEHLSKNGYFGGIGNTFRREGFESKDVNWVRKACLNFARDKVDLIWYFSRKDIWVVAGFGCPVVDRKVVNSGKRLRAHLGIDENNVCSSCLLRGNCERAYAKACKSDGGYTVDVMRLLLTYGLDHVTGIVENKACLNERVTESVRRLLREMVECSKEVKSNPQAANITKWNPSFEGVAHQRQGDGNDWICTRCKFINLADSVNCVQCDGWTRKSGKDHNLLALKKGDWLCKKCNFLNFAKNTRCLECNEKPPKRPLNGGEWECDSCNYINFRRNMVCIRCDHRRPRASFA